MLRMQALSLGHSLFNTHSGRQPWYGSPPYPGMHEQIPLAQLALAPHGDGLQRSLGISSLARAGKKYYVYTVRIFELMGSKLSINKWFLRGGGGARQYVNGSPVNPGIQVQIGVWLMTLHTAATPQAPGQGSAHR